LTNNLATNGAGLGKSGYNFTAVGSSSGAGIVNDQFFITGTPLSNTTGARAYCEAQDNVVRVQTAGNITAVANLGALWSSCSHRELKDARAGRLRAFAPSSLAPISTSKAAGTRSRTRSLAAGTLPAAMTTVTVGVFSPALPCAYNFCVGGTLELSL